MEDDFLKVAKQAALEAEKAIQKYSGKTSQKNIKHNDPNEPDWNKERLNIVASNGLIHDAILEALKG